MIRFLSVIAVILLLVISGLLIKDFLGIPSKTLVIFYTSNLRGQIKPFSGTVFDKHYDQVGGLAFIRGFIDQTVRNYDLNPRHVLLLDTGDAIFGSAEASLTLGEIPFELMIKTGYDAMAAGNMDFEFGIDVLRNFASSGRLPILACNYRDLKSQIGVTFLPGKIIDKAGIKVGVIGLGHGNLARNTRQENIIDLEITEIQSAVAKTAAELRMQGAELLILLSHHPELDLIPDLPAHFPEIDVIIGDVIGPPILQLERPLVCQTAPQRGSGIGMVKIPYVSSGWQLSKAFQHIFPTDSVSIKPDPLLVSEIGRVESKVDSLLEEVIAYAEGDFPRSYNDESALGALITGCIASFASCEIAFQNSGGIKSSIQAGPVLLRHLYEMLPFENSIVRTTLKGWQIENLIEESLSQRGSFIQASGIRCVYSSSNPIGFKIIQIDIGGEPLEFDKSYSVAANDFMASNKLGWPELSQGTSLENIGLLRENLKESFKAKNHLIPCSEKNFIDFQGSDETLRIQALSHDLASLPAPVSHDATANSEYGRLLAEIIRLETDSDFAIVPIKQINSRSTILEKITPARIISDIPESTAISSIILSGDQFRRILETSLTDKSNEAFFAGCSLELSDGRLQRIFPWSGEFSDKKAYKIAFSELLSLKVEGKYDFSSIKTVRYFTDVRRTFINGIRRRQGKVDLRRAFF